MQTHSQFRILPALAHYPELVHVPHTLTINSFSWFVYLPLKTGSIQGYILLVFHLLIPNSWLSTEVLINCELIYKPLSPLTYQIINKHFQALPPSPKASLQSTDTGDHAPGSTGTAHQAGNDSLML